MIKTTLSRRALFSALAAAFLLTGCKEEIRIDADAQYITPVTMEIDANCYTQFAEGDFSTVTTTCDQLGKAIVASGVEARIQPKLRTKKIDTQKDDWSFDVAVEFLKNGKKLNIPAYYYNATLFEMNALHLEISYVNENDIFITSTLHESYPSTIHYDGKKWSDFSTWDAVKAQFPDTIQPPLSLVASPEYLKITEENYCCDFTYTNTSDRKKFRMEYVIYRTNGEIVQTANVRR